MGTKKRLGKSMSMLLFSSCDNDLLSKNRVGRFNVVKWKNNKVEPYYGNWESWIEIIRPIGTSKSILLLTITITS